MGLRCAGQLAGDRGGLQGSSPRRAPFPRGPPFLLSQGHPQGERQSQLKPELEVVLAGPGRTGPQAELSVRTLVEPR